MFPPPLHPARIARRTARGITMVEALVCLAILAVLAGLAAPSFHHALQKQRIAAVRTELTTALQWVRWEALRRNATVSLARREDCGLLLRSADEWHCGWDIVATGPEHEREVLQRFELHHGLHLVHPGGGATLAYARSGQPAQVAHKFVVGLPADTSLGVATTSHAITLCMNRTGRVRTIEGQTSC
ncbi:GspH/FimT family pseudopilin [Pseudorhodoferax sp.]|uniref:GspH/FimT family pseudopilin n=1 Tax=Pseudorhodoferax sp. TaxID=1993553 RepID=UPI0039E2C8D4